MARRTLTPPPEEVPFIGLTGGIGAGKSTALAALSDLGAAVLSADAVVHELYESPELIELMVDRFGDSVAPEGRIDRSALARAAFATPGDRAWLEAQLWPRVGARMWDWRQAQSQAEPRPVAAVIEVPLLFESDMDSGFDATLTIVVDEQVRATRAAARGHEAVDERAARQLTQQEKAARSTYVVANDGDIEQLRSKLSDVLAMLSA
jgi:dephospho-CoA kinase